MDRCQNCGVELTENNKYMDGMCMECKCGIDWDVERSIEEIKQNSQKINPYELVGKLYANHTESELLFSDAGEIVDRIIGYVRKDSETLEHFLNKNSDLKLLSMRLRQVRDVINLYIVDVDKYIQMLDFSVNVNNVEEVSENGEN